MTQSRNPHKADILFHINVHEVLPTGEMSGEIVGNEELAIFEIKPVMRYCINGDTKELCLRRLREVLNEFESK